MTSYEMVGTSCQFSHPGTFQVESEGFPGQFITRQHHNSGWSKDPGDQEVNDFMRLAQKNYGVLPEGRDHSGPRPCRINFTCIILFEYSLFNEDILVIQKKSHNNNSSCVLRIGYTYTVSKKNCASDDFFYLLFKTSIFLARFI